MIYLSGGIHTHTHKKTRGQGWSFEETFCELVVCPCLLVILLLLTQFETADPALPVDSQASLSLEAVAYHSPNQRYLYIDPPLPGRGLEVGRFSSIKVYSATPSYVPVKALSYLVGKQR